MSLDLQWIQDNAPSIFKLLMNQDQRRNVVDLLDAVNAYSTGDIAQTDLPTTHEEEEPEEVLAGTPGGLRVVRTPRGVEGIDESGAVRLLYGLLDGERVGLFLFGADGLLEAAHEEGGSTLYNASGSEALTIRDGVLTVLNDAGAVRARLAADRDNVAAAISIHGNPILDRAMRIHAGENGGRIFGTWTDADGRIIDTGGLNLNFQTGRLTAFPGIGTATEPAYVRLPKATVVGPSAAITGIGTTMTQVVSISVATDQACDIHVFGTLTVTLSLGATRNDAWRHDVTVDGIGQPMAVAPPNPGATGQFQGQPFSFYFSAIAPGTHTIALRARTVTAGDTLSVGANHAQLTAQATLA